MSGIDHDALRFGPLAGKAGEDAVKHPEPAPADETVVERLVRAVAFGRVLPLQAVLDDIDDAAHHPPVIHPRHAMSQGEERRKAKSAPSDARSTGTDHPSQPPHRRL